MNEPVRPDRGMLVTATSGELCRLGRLYHADVDAMEATLTDLFGWTGSTTARWARRRVAGSETNDERFRHDFPRVLHALASEKAVR